MSHKEGYIFTNKNHPQKGIMSTVLGVLSVASICAVIYFAFQNKGVAQFRYGTVVLLTTIFSMVGMTLSVVSRMEKDKYHLFSYLGMIFNFIALAAISFILYAGAYGI